MSDDEYQLTRRKFLQHSAMASATAAGYYSIAMKTDALAANVPQPEALRGEKLSPYPYTDPPDPDPDPPE